jgi:hypothetical protein
VSKFRAKKSPCLHGHIHASRGEAGRCNELHILERADKIHGLQNQPFFAFVIDGEAPKMGNGHRLGVTLDFSYIEGGKLVAEDFKGRSRLSDSRDWPIRKALFKHLYKAWELREVRSA